MFRKLLKTLLIILFVILGLNGIIYVGLKVWQHKDKGDIPRVLESALVSFNKSTTNPYIEEFKKTIGGTALGVCHPEDDEYNISLLNEASITWVRFDIPSESPFVFDDDGNPILINGEYQLTNRYKAFKERCMIYQNKGIKVMAITPYVDDMLNEAGIIDVFNKGGEYTEKFENLVKNVSKFYANDLNGYVNMFQISNELTIDKWQGALTIDQICYYQGELQMKSMYPITKENDIPIGFNVCGYTLYYYPKEMCDTYGDYFDYIALDLYLGCFEASYKTTLIYDLLLRHFYNISNKPVLMNEFGYISTGSPLTDNEKEEYLLNTYGIDFSTEDKIRENIVEFLDKFDEVSLEKDGSPMTREARRVMEENGGEETEKGRKAAADYIFSEAQISHLYKSLDNGYELSNYKHTEEDQAKFFKDTITRLSHSKFICGYFVYCYGDSDECYQCGQENCPVETAWGLVRLDELKKGELYNETNVTKKPSYYAIKEVYTKIQNKNNKKYNK